MPAGTDLQPPALLPAAQHAPALAVGERSALALAAGAAAALAALLLLAWALPQALPEPRLSPGGAALLVLIAAAALIGGLSLALRTALRGAPWRPLAAGPGAPQAQTAHAAQPIATATPRSASPLGWQIDLLRRLPGVALLLQPAPGDWVVIAVHRAAEAAPGTGAEPAWSDLPPGLSQERLQPLTQLLAAHPRWPLAAIRACLPSGSGTPAPGNAVPGPGPGQGPIARCLPLADGACVAWLPPDGASMPLLDERESIAYSVSHDLRAPIRVIEGFTRIVREDYGQVLDRIGNDHLDRVLGASTRMNSMIDALLALSRLSSQPLARQAVPLSQMAGQIAQELQQQAPQRRVEFAIQPGLTAQGDPTLLHSLLENLLGNAWKYSARREVAHIALRCTPRQLPAEEGSNATPRPVYEVSDDGAGFDMRFAERLFSPFQRLHSASEFTGHGVGLASVRRIVQRHGGEIWAEAQVDRGARFYFTLP
jgi:signal transduction histidine kinase